MNIAIVVVTHNRLEYTRKTIARLLKDPAEEFDLYLWDNASTDETPEYIEDAVKDSRIVEVIRSRDNVGQTGAMNYVWSRTKAELVGKVDNDCLVTPGWTRVFAQAHKDVSQLGAIACWHFLEDDFDFERARNKIQIFGHHKILRHPWVCGSGFIMKRSTFEKHGYWKSDVQTGTTYYFLKMALSGSINGWYYPFVLQEHLDDPANPECVVKDRESFRKYQNITYGLKKRRYFDVAGRLKWRQQIVRNIIEDPYDPRYYTRRRKTWRKIKSKVRKSIDHLTA